ncbi:MAG: hypothetical protein ACO1SV_04095 [Fimbriimonas sp.]
MRLLVSCAFLILLPVFAVAQEEEPPTLKAHLDAMAWDAMKNGPLLAIEPERTFAVGKVTGLDAFARKRVTVRGLTAIIPTTMVTVVENPPAGNLVDGLPREAKVVYLLTKLTPAQWRGISTRGIGRADLDGEARAVFDSLLPNPFAWQKLHVTANGRGAVMADRTGEEGVLGERERDGVRLRVVQSLTVAAALTGRPASQIPFNMDDDLGNEGTVVYARNDRSEKERSEAFEIRLRDTEPNRTKPSHLSYTGSSFDRPVPLTSPIKVGALLARIGAATGHEILAGLRVRDRTVTLFGDRARAGDLLEALALGVTGTYRRVLDAYVLTSDLDGMGARKLRLALWSDEPPPIARLDATLDGWLIGKK